MANSYVCDGCREQFGTMRGLTVHWNWHPDCRALVLPQFESESSENGSIYSNGDNDIAVFDNARSNTGISIDDANDNHLTNSNDASTVELIDPNVDRSLIEKKGNIRHHAQKIHLLIPRIAISRSSTFFIY